MNEQLQRNAIAEAMPENLICFQDGQAMIRKGGDIFVQFDPLNDLNHMREAENGLDERQFNRYADILCDMVASGDPDPNITGLIKLTASQRADAFLRAIVKWKD